MRVEVSEETSVNLEHYAELPISFEVRQVFDVSESEHAPGEFTLSARRLEAPYLKDYDAIEHPRHWASSFDLSNWGFFAARFEGHRVGGAVVAFRTMNLDILENRTDLAILWDIRVSPDARRRGIGAALFTSAENWAAAKGCGQLKVETQNINFPACKFYARQGCVLREIRRFAYPQLPDEVQMFWYKDLRP